MNNHYTSFKDPALKQKLHGREQTPQEQNTVQLLNWLGEMKSSIAKIGSDLTEYRIAQVRQQMEIKDFLRAAADESKKTNSMLEMILQHLTSPGSVSVVDGKAVQNTEEIAIRVSDILSRQLSSMVPQSTTTVFEKPVVKEEAFVKFIPEKKKRGTYNIEANAEKIFKTGKKLNAAGLYEELKIIFPDGEFTKSSVATSLSIMCKKEVIKRIDRGMYAINEASY